MVIKLNTNKDFKLIPEGEQILTIVDAKVTPSGAPQQIQIKFEDTNGASMLKTYKFEHSGAMYYFGTLLSALGIGDGETFDTNDAYKLIGRQLIVVVEHTEYNGKTYADPVDFIAIDTTTEEVEYPDTSVLETNDIEIDGL
jgi:hypothetical protein